MSNRPPHTRTPTTAASAQAEGIGYAVSGLTPFHGRIATLLWTEPTCVRHPSAAAAVTAIRTEQTYRFPPS